MDPIEGSETSANINQTPLKMDPTEGSETSANINQTLGIRPKIETVNSYTVAQIVTQ
jgi:hypothetical protein